MAVLITGAKGGLGTAVTRAFLDAGAAVVGISRTLSASDFPQPSFTPLAADLTSPADAARALNLALQAAGRVDVLVHVMGGFAGGSTVWETDDATWEQMFALNFRPALYVARAVVPHMLERGRGRIIAIASRQALEPSPGVGAYNASKAALLALVRTLALELKDTGITANAVLPGTMDTPSNRAAMPAADFSRWVDPRAVASLVLWLASDEAADVNGAAIPVYGKG